MRSTNQTLVTAFALFSLFFGAGNLILPPFLGFSAGTGWSLVTLGFAVSAVLIPILGIIAHARLQGTMLDFGNKVHPVFSIIYCVLIYAVAISLPAPRTAAVTYEMSIAPYFSVSPLIFSALYFGLVFLFAINRTRLLDIIGKYLTPLLIMILIMIIGIGIFSGGEPNLANTLEQPFSEGFLEGYQTFDAIAAMVVGAVVIVSLNLNQNGDYSHKRKVIMRGALLAGMALVLIYTGLIYVGALYIPAQPTDSRTELLSFISYDTLGSGGRILLATSVGIACFTTATGAVTGTADFIQGLFKGSKKAYFITLFFACALGVLIGQFNTDFIIAIAVPALFFVYPITIILILLNVMPRKWISHWVFKAVVLVTLLFSLPDFLHSLNRTSLDMVRNTIPLGNWGLGWTLPAAITFIAVNILLYFFGKGEDNKPSEITENQSK
ncbi:branched-chain amino acid transport system II carrier protein [Flavimarina sp. Hel_I_48]|uniref:branched-chain amino acid transport system II carrier protein n=1 Tax=Flavimarina sp. Hel_I_48 TaxID=1392488 RepID=UPI00055CCA23|nr:branched-chain amino acid transport system II carrier protein [Flavimarina sp. Hel_I_48]